MRDAYLTLFPNGTALTGNTNGTAVNLLANTDKDFKGVAGVNLVAGVYTAPLRIFVNVLSLGGGGATLTFEESDDNSSWGPVTPASVLVITAVGESQLAFTPLKQFQRARASSVTGTVTLHAEIGVREH